MSVADSPRELPNRLLARVGKQEFSGLAAHLEDVTLRQKQVLYEPGQPIEYVYFPAGGVVSLLTVMRDGTGIETATVGNEGMVGTPVVLGAESTHNKAICQIPGNAKRMPAKALAEVIEHAPPLRRLLGRYVQGQTIQFTQGVACNALHSVEQRCAKWLLMSHDRVEGDWFPLTQQFLAQMLAVRRASVTKSAGKLQKAGVIAYSHGKVTVLDRKGLEAAACECYGVIVREFERLFGADRRDS